MYLSYFRKKLALQRDFLEKIVVVRLVKRCPQVYKPYNFIAVFTGVLSLWNRHTRNARHWCRCACAMEPSKQPSSHSWTMKFEALRKVTSARLFATWLNIASSEMIMYDGSKGSSLIRNPQFKSMDKQRCLSRAPPLCYLVAAGTRKLPWIFGVH